MKHSTMKSVLVFIAILNLSCSSGDFSGSSPSKTKSASLPSKEKEPPKSIDAKVEPAVLETPAKTEPVLAPQVVKPVENKALAVPAAVRPSGSLVVRAVCTPYLCKSGDSYMTCGPSCDDSSQSVVATPQSCQAAGKGFCPNTWRFENYLGTSVPAFASCSPGTSPANYVRSASTNNQVIGYDCLKD